MATLSHLPPFQSLSSNKLLSSSLRVFHHKLHYYSHRNLPRICASLTKKSRASRKGKSDEDLRNDLREFLSMVGLPQEHVPSTKELSQHGRQDLANIVRRRGYKYITELLAVQIHKQNETVQDLTDDISLASDSTEVAKQMEDLVEDVLPSIKATKGEVNMNDLADDIFLSREATEVKRRPEDLVEDIMLSSEATTLEENANDFADDISLSREATEVQRQTEDLVEDVSLSSKFTKGGENVNDFSDDISLLSEATEVRQTEDLVEDVFSSSEVMKDKENMNDVTDYNALSSEATEVERQAEDLAEDLSIADKATIDEENMINLAEDVSQCEATISKDNIPNAEMSRELKPDDHSYTGPNSPSNLSLQERVARFVQGGELDDIEDSGFEILKKSPSVDSMEFTKSLDAIEPKSYSTHGTHEDHASSGAGDSYLSNGHIPLSSQPVEHPAQEPNAPRAEILSNEKVMVVSHNEDLDVEAQNTENQAEINRLKYILHQKELELTKLKEQIEKEKLALFHLQSKAEKEINEAQKLISQKDAELHVAEEGLLGLKEVEILYWGEGEIVEVAGSFNGWHQRIKMDPLPSSNISDLTGSRRSRLWKTELWLYPGVYEIKFISDGHWTIDPQRESVSRGGIHNNILRVDR